MKNTGLLFALVASLYCNPLYAAAPAADVVAKARLLLSSGKAQESYALLSRDQDSYAEDVEYNYLLGVSALDAGKPGAAVFAFERVLAIDPNHALARAEMARAMMTMGELNGARQELVQVREMAPPPEAAKVIDSYLDEIDRVEKASSLAAGKSILTGYIEAELGYDTNLNTAPNTTTIFIPVLSLPGTLSGFAKSQESWFLGLNGGATWYKPVNDNVGVFATLDAKARYNAHAADFVPVSVYGTVGGRVTRGVDQFSFGLTQFTYYINQFHNDDQTGGFFQWQREFSNQDVGGAFAQYVRVDHPIARNLNTDLFLVGGFWTHAFMRTGDPVLSLVAYAGDDRQLGDDPTAGRQLYGAKASLEYKLSDRYKLFGGFGTQYSRYGGTNIWFMTKREDARYDLNVGVVYKPSKQWTITPQLTYTKNDSTVGFNEWDRAQAYVTARRDFF